MEEIKQGYKQTDIGVIPEDWTLKSLLFLSEKIMVGIASSATYAYRLTGVKMFRNQNIKPNFLDDKDIIYLDPNYEVLFRNKRLQEGDLLTARTGYPGTTCIVPKKHDGSQSFTTLISRIKHDLINVDYLCYYINSEFGQSFFDQNKIGGGQQNVNAATLKIMPIPYPKNKDEQTAIATALSETDALIAALDKKIAKKQQIKQGAMQQLLTGKKRLPGFSGEWAFIRLGSVTDISRGGSPRPIENYLTNDVNGVNWIKIGDVGVNAKFIESTEEKIIQEGVSRSRFVKRGDFLLSNSMSFGRPYILKVDGCIHDGWLVIQNYQETFNTDYLYYMLGFESTLTQYKSVAAGSSVLNLNKQIVSNVLIFCPQKEEQTAIAQILTDMDKEIAQLEKERDKYKELKAGMMQVLLTGRIRLI